jgi:hypothetical protein
MEVQERDYQESDDIPFKDICHYKRHLFFDDEAIINVQNDITRKCFVCEELIKFYYYSNEDMKKKLLMKQ